MQLLQYLLWGALIGAVVGWLICASYYFWNERIRYGIGFNWVTARLPETFWPTTGRFALVGALIGLGWVIVKFILSPYICHSAILQ